MSLTRIFDVAGSAVSAQSQRLNVVASNLANADAVAGPDGQTGVVTGREVDVLLGKRRRRIPYLAAALSEREARTGHLRSSGSGRYRVCG